MPSTEHNTSGHDGVLPAVDLEHPGFFPFARFSHATRNAQADIKPLSSRPDVSIWPYALGSSGSKGGGTATSRRK